MTYSGTDLDNMPVQLDVIALGGVGPRPVVVGDGVVPRYRRIDSEGMFIPARQRYTQVLQMPQC